MGSVIWPKTKLLSDKAQCSLGFSLPFSLFPPVLQAVNGHLTSLFVTFIKTHVKELYKYNPNVDLESCYHDGGCPCLVILQNNQVLCWEGDQIMQVSSTSSPSLLTNVVKALAASNLIMSVPHLTIAQIHTPLHMHGGGPLHTLETHQEWEI